MSIDILGVRINRGSASDHLRTIRGFLADGKQHTVFTPNPEMLVDASSDAYFRAVLNTSSLNICDGTGLVIASRGTLRRVSGSDMAWDIAALAEGAGKSLYLLGTGDAHTVMMAREKLLHQFPKLRVAGAHPGIPIRTAGERLQYDALLNNKMIQDVNCEKPDILFVAFGHGKQEKWLFENLPALPSVAVAMGVGGALDMIAGKTRRAPKFLRLLGLEWLWRLLLEPKRIGRIWKATALFPLLLIFGGREKK
jgi:N-acetylglucosaminyldiphosphoundecaprenol N-acetyl-beta-D-mannosaminyltransferase